MHTLTKAQLTDIANGATFLGCGGGWPRYSAMQVLKEFPEDAMVQVATVEEAAADSEKLTVMLAYIGAPTAAANLHSVHGGLRAFDLANEYAISALGKEIGYVIPVEIGALNTIAPCLVSWGRGIAVVDGDGAGRAVPALPMTTFAQAVAPNPMILTNSKDYQVTLRSLRGAVQADDMARYLLADPAFDNIAGLTMWIMDGPQLQKAVPIRQTLLLAQGVGETLRTATDPVPAVIAYLGGQGRWATNLFTGVLTGESDSEQGGFDIGETRLRDPSSGVVAVVYDENENLMAWRSDCSRPMALSPDSICYVTEDGFPFSNADVDYYKLKGKTVSLVGVAADSALLNDAGAMTSFRSALINLGYAGAYVPIQDLTC